VDVQLLLDVVKFGMHMFDLGAQTPAIIELNSPTEITVELPRFRPDMFIVGHDGRRVSRTAGSGEASSEMQSSQFG
jgi:hypothetical protein